MLVLLLERLNVAVDVSEASFEVIDLIIKDFIVSMDSNFAVNKRVHCLGHLVEVLIVKLVKLLHQRLWIASLHASSSRCIHTHVLVLLHILLGELRGLLIDSLLSTPSQLALRCLAGRLH